MAEGFVLNIPQEMLNRLQKADEKIEKLDKASRRVGENIRLAFEQGAKGVDKFIGSLNSAQKILDGFKDKKINVGLNLDAKAVTDLKKQLENLGVKIPVGVTATGGGSGSSGGSSGGSAGESQSLKNLLDGIVTLTKSVNNLTQKIDGIKVTGSGSTSGGSGSSNSGKQQQTKVDPIVNSQNAKSISERIQAIKLLQKEMFNLDTTDKNYQRTLNTLNTELTRQQSVLKQVGVEISKIKTPKIEIPKPNFEPLRQQYQQNRQEIDKLIAKENEFVKKVQENQKIINNSQIKKSDSYNEKQRKTDLIASLEQENQLHQRSINTIQTETQKYRDANQAIRERMTLLGQEYREKVKLQQANDPKNLALIAKEKKEYEELLKTIRQLEKEKKKAGDTVIDSQRGSSKEKLAQSIYTQTKNELDQLYKRRTQLEQKYGAELSAIQRANNMKDLQELIKLENEKLKVQEQAEQKALQQYTKLASERNRLLTEQYNNQKIINNPKTDNATRQQAIKQQQLIAAELQRNKQAMLNIEQQYQGKLATIQQRAGQQELQRIRRQKQQEIDEIRRAEQRRQDIQRRWDERRYSRPQGALQYSQNAKTINEQIKAIEYLKKAQKSLDVSTSQGKKQFNELEKEIKKTENALRRYGVQLGGVREQSSHLFNISQQLGRALSLMFSVSQIGQYVSKMVNVRKEMELQQRSLQVLLQSKDKANELWNQTLDLAVKSPYRVKELVTYTKQLAAYRIESDKLFETNKMLADVSAGLGVDMQRLILAFGQVKSASFLRGTELRQFTEAGIPMLEELSKYFSEIYGKSISVAEVFDMISKRMVTFTDVENVFQRMTSAGGVFFNMQEELSQTTAGMISNLQDSIDLMFNEIGKRNQGVINTAIKWARGLVDNWETIGRVMKGTLVTLLLYKTATMDINKSLAGIRAKWGNISAGFSLLKSDTSGFVSIFKGNIILTALTAIAAILAVIIKRHMEYKAAIKEIVKEYDKLDSTLNNLTIDIYQTDDLDEAKQKLLELKNVAKSDFGINVDIQLQNLDSIEQVREEFNKLEQQLKSMNDFTYVIKYQMVEEDTGKEKRERNKEKREANRDEDLTNDMAKSKGITKDIERLDEYSDRLNNTFIKVDSLLSDLLRKQNELNDVQIQFVEAFNEQGDTESDADFFNRRMEGLKLLTEQYEKFYNEVDVDEESDIAENVQRMLGALKRIKTDLGLDVNAEAIKELLKNYNKQLNTVNSGIKKALESSWGLLDKQIATLENEMRSQGKDENEISESIKKLIETYYTSAIKSVSTDKEWDDLTEHQAYLVGEQIAKEKGYTVNLVPKIEPPKDIELLDWQKAFNQEVEDVNKELQNIAKTKEFKEVFMFKPFEIAKDSVGLSTTKEKKRTALNEEIDRIEKEIQDEKKANANLKALLKSGEITKETYDALYNYAVQDKEKYQKYLEYLRDLLGGDDDKTKGGKSQLQLIKDQIALIRQLYDRYQELSQVMGSIKAKGEVTNSFRDAVSVLELGDIEKIDFTNLGGIVTALEGLIPKAQKIGKKAVQTLQKAIGDSKVDLELMLYIQKQEEFENKIKDMFSDYEVSLELEKLDIPANWAETFFGVETKSLDEIKNALNERKKEIDDANKTTSTELAKYDKENLTEQEKQIKKALQIQVDGYKKESAFIAEEERKIAEMEAQQQEQRLKTYLEYARKAIGEKAKIKLEEYRKLQEIDETFVAKEDATEEEKALFESTKKQAQAGVRREAREKQQKLEWEEFQKTDTFINIFDDLESASGDLLRHTLSKLNEFKDVWTDMPLEDMEKVVDAINKIENALAKIKPVEAKRQAKDTIDNIMKDFTYTDKETGEERKFEGNRRQFEKVVETELAKNEDEMAKTKDDIANLETALRLLQENNLETVNLMFKRDQTTDFKEIIKLIEEGVDDETLQKTIEDKDLFDFSNIFNEYKKQVDNKSNGGDFDTSILENILSGANQSISDELKALLEDIINSKDLGIDIGGLLQPSQIEFNSPEGVEQGQLETDLSSVTAENQQKITKEVEKQLKTQQKKQKQQEKENKTLNDAKNATETIKVSNEEIIDRMIEINKAVDTVTEGLDSVVEVMKVWGKDTAALELISGIAGEVANSVSSMLSFHKEIKAASEGAEGFGKAMNTAMGIIGWIVMAVQLISKILTMVAEYRDKQIVKQIEAIAKEIEKLEKKYEKLSESIEEGFAESSIVSAYNEANKTLDEMLVKQQKMIDLNDTRKQTDEVKKEREEMEKEMEEMYEKQEELREQYFSKITGGAFDSVLDTAGEFVDAWLEAFKETGDGLSGLEENFDEMFGQIVKQQASMLISDQFMKEWQDRLKQLSEGGLTTDEIKDWSNLVENDFPALNDALKTFYSNFEGFVDETNSLTGLQRGIQGITESQADILASYANSCRFLLASIDTNLSQLASRVMSQTGGSENLMLSELKSQTQILSSIKDMFSSVIKGSHPTYGGSFIKVGI